MPPMFTEPWKTSSFNNSPALYVPNYYTRTLQSGKKANEEN